MQTIKKLSLVFMMVAALLMLAAPSLFGYGRLDYYYNSDIKYEHWINTSNIVWYIDDESKPSYQQGCQESFDNWENIPYTDINFSYGGTVAIYMDYEDGYNVISFNNFYVGWGSALGFTTNWVDRPTGEIYESDIMLNPRAKWTTGTPKGNQVHIQSVVTHELGHFQGLCHSMVRDATMYPFILSGTESASLEMDDTCGHGNMYGNSSFFNTFGTISGHISQGGTGNVVPGAHVMSMPPDAIYYTDAVSGVYSDPNGDYFMYAPAAEYGLYIEPLDGDPASHVPSRVNEVVEVTADTDFPEEWWNTNDGNCEEGGLASFFTLTAGGSVTGKDFVTNENCAGDTVSPADVTDLAASTGTSNGTVDLTWTAPGDDGNTGTATTYDVRYQLASLGPLDTEAEWDAASQATGEPDPQPAGSTENFTVTGLTPGTAYYFALKTADEVPNWSGLSNSDSATAAEVPETPMFVESIAMRTKAAGPNVTAYAKPHVVEDVAGTPDLAGVTVYGHWYGATSDVDECVTGSDGTCEVESDRVKNPTQDFCFQVDSLVKTNYYWDDTKGVTYNCISPTGKFAKSAPADFTISQNYPNPFNPTTEFSIDLPSPTHVNFVIYNVAGQKVKTLVDDYLDAGVHAITWDGTNESGEVVSSGIYFCRVVADENMVARKMILMK